MLRLEGIQKRYGGRLVLDIPAFTFEPGRRYALVGHNGSGKTTLLRILARQLAPDSGTIVPDERNGTGYLPQKPYIFSCSALHNLTLALEQGSRTEKHAAAHAALSAVGMADFARARGETLSGGEAQRLALARVLLRDWAILLLDEPTSATDVAGCAMVELVLQDYHARTGCTLIVATHSPAQARRLADVVLIFENGTLKAWGSPADLLAAP